MMSFNSPKNFKRGRYILNRYRIKDLFVLVCITVICVAGLVGYLNFFMNKNILINLLIVFIFILPIGVAYLLVTPMPVYFNVLDFGKSALQFLTRQKKYKWEGIHLSEEEDQYDEEPQEEHQTKKEEEKYQKGNY